MIIKNTYLITFFKKVVWNLQMQNFQAFLSSASLTEILHFWNLFSPLTLFIDIIHNATLFLGICETGEVFPSKKSRARKGKRGKGGQGDFWPSGGGLAHLLFITARSMLLSLEQTSTIDTSEEWIGGSRRSHRWGRQHLRPGFFSLPRKRDCCLKSVSASNGSFYWACT